MNRKIRMEDMDPATIESLRQVIREEIQPLKETLDLHTQILNEHSQKLDTLTGEVIELQTITGAVWDAVALGDTRNKREIDEIKARLDLKPLDPL